MATTVDSIRDLLEREPFQPFRIRASSGKAYEIRRHGLAMLLRSQIFIAEPKTDSYAVIPFLHVAGIELIGNGRGRRKGRTRQR